MAKIAFSTYSYRCFMSQISSSPRQRLACLHHPSGKRFFHLWTSLSGITITTWCRPSRNQMGVIFYFKLFFFAKNDCWQQLPAALKSHQTVECRERLSCPTSKVLLCGLFNLRHMDERGGGQLSQKQQWERKQQNTKAEQTKRGAGVLDVQLVWVFML